MCRIFAWYWPVPFSRSSFFRGVGVLGVSWQQHCVPLFSGTPLSVARVLRNYFTWFHRRYGSRVSHVKWTVLSRIWALCFAHAHAHVNARIRHRFYLFIFINACMCKRNRCIHTWCETSVWFQCCSARQINLLLATVLLPSLHFSIGSHIFLTIFVCSPWPLVFLCHSQIYVLSVGGFACDSAEVEWLHVCSCPSISVRFHVIFPLKFPASVSHEQYCSIKGHQTTESIDNFARTDKTLCAIVGNCVEGQTLPTITQ